MKRIKQFFQIFTIGIVSFLTAVTIFLMGYSSTVQSYTFECRTAKSCSECTLGEICQEKETSGCPFGEKVVACCKVTKP
ncbi:MAG: hypothetical protein QXJ06_06075 [Candidatus Aenigmatarchaeota archaeon]